MTAPYPEEDPSRQTRHISLVKFISIWSSVSSFANLPKECIFPETCNHWAELGSSKPHFLWLFPSQHSPLFGVALENQCSSPNKNCNNHPVQPSPATIPKPTKKTVRSTGTKGGAPCRCTSCNRTWLWKGPKVPHRFRAHRGLEHHFWMCCLLLEVFPSNMC